MNIFKCTKASFSVIGKEGSTGDGAGFVQLLWNDANSHFAEVAHLAKKNENGNLLGIWGAMTDFSRNFLPWEEGFSKGLYLAGVECRDDAAPPEGWTKWVIPGFEYLYVECDRETVFREMLQYLAENKIELTGAVHMTSPAPRPAKTICSFRFKGYKAQRAHRRVCSSVRVEKPCHCQWQSFLLIMDDLTTNADEGFEEIMERIGRALAGGAHPRRI